MTSREGWQNGQGTWAVDKDVMAVHDWIVGKHRDLTAIVAKPTKMMPFRPKGQTGKPMNVAAVTVTRTSVVLVLAIPPATPKPATAVSSFSQCREYLRVRIPRQQLANELPKLTPLLEKAWTNIVPRTTD